MNNNTKLDSKNLENIWIDVCTVAKLKGISKRAVRISLGKNKYIYKTEKVRGGKSYQIKLSSLEEEYQIKYVQEYYDNSQVQNGQLIELSNLNLKQEIMVSEKQKKLALAKYDIVSCWLEFRKNYKKNKFDPISSDKKFIELFNTGLLHENLYNIVGKISFGSLYRWRTALKENGDWTSLVGKYRYTGFGKYKTSLNEEQQEILLKILLSPNSFSIGKSISLTKHILQEKGYTILPKDVTFRRFANWFKDNNYDAWILAREGQKALKDKVEPYIVRNASLLKPGQVLIADGHDLNFQVINPFTGKPCRATLIGFLDWKSGGLVGYVI